MTNFLPPSAYYQECCEIQPFIDENHTLVVAIHSLSPTHTYYLGNAEIHFSVDEDDVLFVSIHTERLHLRSIQATEQEVENYASLLGDKKVMAKYGTGQIKSKQETQHLIDFWVGLWQRQDPYSGLAVFEKETNDFIGHIILGHEGTAGQAEIAYLFKKNQWGKGFASEAVAVVVEGYAPATIKEGYTLAGKPLERMIATVRTDNPFSRRILEKVGMHLIGQEKKYGTLRYSYAIDLKVIADENISID